MTSGYTSKFRLTAKAIQGLMETQVGRAEVGAEVERFRRANGMRAGLNMTTEELKAEALHWADHPE